MSIKKKLVRFAFKRGFILKKMIEVIKIHDFIARFRENYSAVELMRIGGDGDGGYLLPDVFHSISHCFSPGVAFTANFESELSQKYGIKSFMADASVSKAPLQDKNFTFIKKHIGLRSDGKFITLGDWLAISLDGTERGLLLQMDIEGGEYDVLTLESVNTLQRFSVMVIEFHYLQNMLDTQFFCRVQSVFEKIYKGFAICHVHPNNNGGVLRFKDIEIPRVMEVTFLRRDLVKKYKSGAKLFLPHKLDQKNVLGKKDIIMPDLWWKCEA